MPKEQAPAVVTRDQPEKPEGIIVNKIVIQAVDRSVKDINDWRRSHVSATSPYYANRSRLYDLYDDVQLDGTLTGLIEKRIAGVLNKNIHYNVNGQKVDEFDATIKSDVFRAAIKERILAKFWGVSGMEFIPGEKLAFISIPRKHIKPELGIIATEQSGVTGYEYKKIPNIIVCGEKNDVGLLLKCCPYAIYKRGALADWGQYIEIFGMPIRVIKYDAFDSKTKLELQEVLDESGGALALMIPKQADFEMMDGKATNADGKLQETFRKALNDEMSIIVLGNTETTSSSSSSGYAQSKEHGKQQLEITKSDIKEVANFLNSPEFITVLKSYGLPVAEGGEFEFEKEINLEDLKTKVAIDVAVSAKVPIEDDYWYNTYGIPKPANYAELRKKMDEKEKLQLQPNASPGNQNPPGKKNNKPPKGNPVKMKLSAWHKVRQTLADFFDPALH